MRFIELSTWNDIQQRVNNIVRSLEIIYETKLAVDVETVPLGRIFPTEDFLENDKLALVFMKIVREKYDVPIVAVRKGEEYFVLDGHHRTFIHKKLQDETIQSHVLKFPKGKEYRNILVRPFEDLRMKDVSTVEDPIVKAWQRILIVVEHYEAIYHVPFYLRRQ